MNARPSMVLLTQDAGLGSAMSAILAPIADVRIATQAEAWNARRAIAFPCVTIVDARALDREIARTLREARPDLVLVLSDDARQRETAENAGAFALLSLTPDASALRTAVRQALEHLDATEALAARNDARAHRLADAAPVAGAPCSASLLAAALHSLQRPESLDERVLECLAVPAGAARALLYRVTGDDGTFALRHRIGPVQPGTPDRFGDDAPLVQRFRAHPAILSRLAVAHDSDPGERHAIVRLLNLFGADLIVPLFSTTDLAGWIVLGPRASGLGYNAQDLEELAGTARALSALLELAAARTAPALEPEQVWSDLSDSLSHELRNPLVAIKTFAQLLPERFEDAEFRDAFGKLVLEEIGRIAEVIDTVEQFAHPAPLARARIDLRRIVEDTVERSLDTARRRNLRLTVRIEPALPAVDADAAALARALEQLLRRADEAVAKQPDPEIRVTAVTRNGADGRRCVAVSVGDNAPALPAAERAKLFEPFASARIRGTGLGLPEARRTLVRHGGRLFAEAGRTGTLLTMELPAAPEEAG